MRLEWGLVTTLRGLGAARGCCAQRHVRDNSSLAGVLLGALLAIAPGCPSNPPPAGTTWWQGKQTTVGGFHPPLTVKYLGSGQLQVIVDTAGDSRVTAGHGGSATDPGSEGSVEDVSDDTQGQNPAVVSVVNSTWVEVSSPTSLLPKRFKL